MNQHRPIKTLWRALQPARDLLLLGTIVVLIGPTCFGDEPYSARGQTQVFQVSADGSKQLMRSINVVEARNREGSRYTAQELPTGKVVILWQKSSGLLYQIDTSAKKAILVDKSYDLMAGPRSAPETQDPAAKAAHLGIPCVNLPVRQGSPGKLTKVGENCVSFDLGLILKSDATLKVDQNTVITTTAMAEVKRGVEPDPGWFEIPRDYTIIERQMRR
ncbi:hypothetical protein F183_A06430 [Bryobacterales bacterium F-183]|nr:hypothetical protein F183_A06430 [Bryobacterales bacterium F-183]